MMKSTSPRYKVYPLSVERIRSIAQSLRGNSTGSFDILNFLDVQANRVLEPSEGLKIEVVPSHHIDSAEGITYPSENRILLSEQTYNDLEVGGYRGRFTASHELGHLILHRAGCYPLARTYSELKPFECCEWQANTFAGELLVDSRWLLTNITTPIRDIQSRFIVSKPVVEKSLQRVKKYPLSKSLEEYTSEFLI